ncbi:hypothetical protein RM780_10965 [Streptomyces sp. DSM 44917]|uniref:Uncharacterized protein n=1 Tax=Streptomyces boetiae TaxID=3075541 RepID=A0ABU2L859_9ACTN|nr:hypothetical protein [Streptomyces sp. DSM 44917]MDT0307483.1 hypothetical protein [Streptomyces sp. DSM 44917]
MALTGEPAIEEAGTARARAEAAPDARPEQAGASVAPPSSYRMITPTDWFRIPLRSAAQREKSVQALVDLTYASRDEFAVKRRELRELLTSITDKAVEQLGIELYLSTQGVFGVPIPASLLVTAEPEDPAVRAVLPVEMLADGLRNKHGENADVRVVRLTCGPAVRCRRRELSQDSKDLGQPEDRPSTLLDFYLPVPHSGAWLVLSFSTPLPELADAQVEMFDAVADSFLWA